jgi:hypothetical protein
LVGQREIVFNVACKVDDIGKGWYLNHARPNQTQNHYLTHRAYHDKSPYSSRSDVLQSVHPSLIRFCQQSLPIQNHPISADHTLIRFTVQVGFDQNLFPSESCMGLASEHSALSGSSPSFSLTERMRRNATRS